ncbi:hypothetical protein CDL12_26790 [Handroanthus impetiginosus]|uniref:RRM domain-containing protein n=1 Tax=Handroanthus impetiginosus TaxID=429701 RepID=A0A2G9G671_9LAMI|nr:hypothetical protein CDL12_26790 [Handroanthus impetiginosus]
MDSTEEYAEFLKKVGRTVYIDNISPMVTEAVLRAAFDQFGNVTKVQFIPTFMQPKGVPRAALVEMQNAKQAQEIISEMESSPFMIAGMPRPARAKAAKVEMFSSRPRKPGRIIRCRWLNPKDPSFEVAKKIKNLVKTHAAEASVLLERQLAEEENLDKQQAETLKANYKKLELIDAIFADGTAKRLAKHYRIEREDI